MPFLNRLGAVGFLSVSYLCAPSAPAGERVVLPIAFKSEPRDIGSALSRYMPHFSEKATTLPTAALDLTQAAVKSPEVAATPSDSAILDAVLAGSRDPSSAAFAKDCTLAAPMPASAFARGVVAAR